MNIGDFVWVGEYESYSEDLPCPVCNTNKVVHLILGDGTKVELSCNYCSRGYEPPSGYIKGCYVYEPSVRQVEVQSIRVETDGTSIVSNCRVYYVDRHIGNTREEALEKANAEIERINTQNAEKRNNLSEKAKKSKSYSWNAGYYRRRASEAEKDAKRYQEKAKVMQSKAR